MRFVPILTMKALTLHVELSPNIANACAYRLPTIDASGTLPTPLLRRQSRNDFEHYFQSTGISQ
jgi:hypothetical protein